MSTPEPTPLSHVDETGSVRMVDVGGKDVSRRRARAAGLVRMRPETAQRLRELPKGDALAVAQVAGIMAAKRTSDLVPLCHPIALTDIQLAIEIDEALPGLRVEATTRSVGRTGVEMESLTAVCVTLLTVYDMAKGVDRAMLIGDISLAEKRGGKSGQWTRP